MFFFQSELRQVRQENWILRGGEGASGACGGAGSSGSSNSGEQIQIQKFAQELKAAASTAETSLRYAVLSFVWIIFCSFVTFHAFINFIYSRNNPKEQKLHDLSISFNFTSCSQLLSGVDNLRLLASTMESMHRVEDQTGNYLPDSDEAAGSAP